jgi:alginate O-acetyltransferase complex protein AlgI
MAGAFLALKYPPCGAWAAATLHQHLGIASSSPLAWWGASYLVLRLLSVGFDFLAGTLPHTSFWGFTYYALFPPAFLAGPLERLAPFQARTPLSHALLNHAAWRIGRGAFKKFVLADTLALVSLSPQLAQDVTSPWAAWALAYAYAWRLYWDFSGYSDMAIGAGQILGVRLPENFDRPYQKNNLIAFWNAWHMSLGAWFRTYVFLPFSRAGLRRKWPAVNALGQVLTMTLIGAWHALTPNFLVWGLWHALGLIVVRAWMRRTGAWGRRLGQRKWRRALLSALAWGFTFHYVVIGWVFFALPDLESSGRFLRVMFGR